MSDRGQDLCDAAEDGDEARLSELLAVDGINVNYKDSDYSSSPLHYAARAGNPNIIRLLHQAGAELEIRDEDGYTPLHWTGAMGRRESAALLLLLGAKINSMDNDNDTPLHEAARYGKKNTVKLLIESGANTEVKNKKGNTPRDVGDNKEIKSLIDEFEKQEEGPKNKSNLLKKAIDAENWEVATILALNGASEDPDIFDNLLKNSLRSTNIVFSFVDCVFALMAKLGKELSSISKEDQFKLLDIAGQCENSVAIKKLSKVNIEWFIDVQFVIGAINENKIGAALAMIKENESLAVVRTILTNFVKTFFREGASSDATFQNYAFKIKLDILTIILKKKDILETDNDGNTPLHISTLAETDDIATFLLANGGSASQFRKNKKGKIPKSLPTNNDISQVFVIDFISFALKSPDFETQEFQQVLGYEKEFFCLQPMGNSISLLEFILQRGMIKEREELLLLLIKIDKFRNKTEKDGNKSKKRIIGILRAGIGPCLELKKCISSLSDKFSWTKSKVALMSSLSVFRNMVLGGTFYALDIFTDVQFTREMFGQQMSTRNFLNCQTEMDRRILRMQEVCNIGNGSTAELFLKCQDAAKNVTSYDCNTLQRFTDKNEYQVIGTVSLVHIVLPFAITVLFFINLCISKVIALNKFTILKFPVPPLTKTLKTILECQSYVNNTNKENVKEFEKSNDKLLQKLDEQNKLTNLSMLIEAGTESSFQFLFQSLYFLPTIIVALVDLSSLSDLVDFKILSILISFVTFSWSSFNIRF